MVSFTVSFFKLGHKHGLWNIDTSSGLEDPHGRFDLFQMRSTLLWHVHALSGPGRAVDSPSKCFDCQVKLYTNMHSIGPSLIVLEYLLLLQWTYDVG